MAKRRDEIWENPLVPHVLMRRMYAGMQALRALEPTAARRRAGVRGLRGEEACRASSLLSLGAGDLVSDVPGSVVRAKGPGSARDAVMTRLAPGALLLPGPTDTRERLMLAIGAATALRVQGGGRLVLAYVEGEASTATLWKQVLGSASRVEAPIIFVLLPMGGVREQGAISDRAQGWGVPGMPVDAADAVALYRVMQESVLRARGGDGPSLAECMTWRIPGTERSPSDGVKAMRTLLERRGLLLAKVKVDAQKAARRTVGGAGRSYT